VGSAAPARCQIHWHHSSHVEGEIVQLFVDMAEVRGHEVAFEALKQSPLFQHLEQHILMGCRRNSMSDEEHVGLKFIGGFGDNSWLLIKKAMEKTAELWSPPKLCKVGFDILLFLVIHFDFQKPADADGYLCSQHMHACALMLQLLVNHLIDVMFPSVRPL
jgi:hypothetical protein